jgi:hypothetical protein
MPAQFPRNDITHPLTASASTYPQSYLSPEGDANPISSSWQGFDNESQLHTDMSYLGAPLQTEGGSQGAMPQHGDEIWIPYQMEGTMSMGNGVADQSVVVQNHRDRL